MKSTLNALGRSANMVWLIFSDGKKQYSLHIQCPCRFSKAGKILLSSGDIYCPSDIVSEQEDFDWDEQGNNAFDVIAKDFIDGTLMVENFELKDLNDLSIQFQNGVEFCLFCNNSTEEEQWRFFSKGDGMAHVVVQASGFSLE